jgi:hypothetical protein
MCGAQRGIVASGEHAGKVVVKVSERFFRPAEVELLLGDPAKAREVLGWDPDKMTPVDKLCEEMVDSDIELAKMELAKNDLKKKLKVRRVAGSALHVGPVSGFLVQDRSRLFMTCAVACPVAAAGAILSPPQPTCQAEPNLPRHCRSVISSCVLGGGCMTKFCAW